MLKSLICKKDRTLLEVLRQIDESGYGTAFIVDEDCVLCGVITDGDLRRLVMNRNPLSDPVGNHLNENYIYGHSGDSYQELIARTSQLIRIYPLIDTEGRVVDFFEYHSRVHIPVTKPDLLLGNELSYLTDALLSTWISSSGEYINRFEEEFCSYSDSQFGVACANGTLALQLALSALNIGPGDEVILPDLTFAATINTVLHAGAKPVIVDIEEDSWCIDPLEIKKALGPNTRAVIPVHLFGQPCDMDPILEIARNHNLAVIEDAAQAHGAKYKGQKVGSFGDIGCFSFFGNKVITTGEGGMCTTNNPDLNERLRVFRDHGMSKTKRYWHEVVGFNARMTNMQAAIGCAQLERIELIHQRRRELEVNYKRFFEEFNFLKFQRNDLENREKITWLVCLLVTNGKRNEVIDRFQKEGVDLRPFFYALSSQDLYKEYTFSNRISQKVAAQGVNCPTLPSLDVDSLARQLEKMGDLS